MLRFCLAVCRFCFSAWVGAALLFVINGITQVTFPAFDSVIRNQLVLLRFPAYYACGFGLLGLGIVGLGCCRRGREISRRARRWASAFAIASLLLMLVDYWAVYLPLEAMITPPSAPRPASFVALHRVSAGLNALHVGLAFVAAWIVNSARTPADTAVQAR